MNKASIGTHEGMRRLAISFGDLLQDYYALGGNGTLADLHRSVEFGDTTSDYEHNLIAHALNERFSDRGENHPVRYRNLPGWP